MEVSTSIVAESEVALGFSLNLKTLLSDIVQSQRCRAMTVVTMRLRMLSDFLYLALGYITAGRPDPDEYICYIDAEPEHYCGRPHIWHNRHQALAVDRGIIRIPNPGSTSKPIMPPVASSAPRIFNTLMVFTSWDPAAVTSNWR